MTAFEILNFNRELLSRLDSFGLKVKDYKYVDMYIEYDKMCRKGEKVTYTVSLLAIKYGISERGVYKIIKRLGKDCPQGSV